MAMQAAASLETGRSAGSRFAVLLNANAKRVDERTRATLGQLVAPEDLFISRDPSDANAIADTVVSRRYGTVFTGGGDGTFVSWVNQILDRAERRALPAPRFGVLALGTGNAVAEVVGARPSAHLEDLEAFARGPASPVRRMALLTCDGRRTPFAGLGVDAAVLNDYGWMKQRMASAGLRALGTGLSGYALAIALRSGPRHLRERAPAYCEIVNSGRVAYRIDAKGRQCGPAIGPGELLYAGPCALAAASTVPYYGFGLRAFPFAEARPGMLQLKVATRIPLAALLSHLPQVWDGTFSHPSLLDFQVERVAVRFDRPQPLQIGGDAEGWKSATSFGMAPQPVELVDFGALRRQPRLLN